MRTRPTVAIFRDLLLPASEPFIRAQAECLRHFEPHYFGSRAQADLALPNDRVHLLNHGQFKGKLEEAAFKIAGFSPRFDGLLEHLKPIAIHAHFGSGGALILPVARRLGLPLIVTFHGSDAAMDDEYSRRSHYSQALYVRRRQELINYGSAFLAVSNFVKSKLLASGFPEHKVIVHYIGVDVEFFDCPPSEPRSDLVLFVGRLERSKGCDYLIRAMARVQQSVPHAQLAIIGDGQERRTLERIASEAGCRCRFLGTQPHHEVREWLKRARVFSVPSVKQPSGISEGFGLVFAEAQAMRVPVVSFDTGGISEAVEDQVTGYLGKEKDVEFLAHHIALLLGDRVVHGRLSNAARARVKERFNLSIQSARLEELYGYIAARPDLANGIEAERVSAV